MSKSKKNKSSRGPTLSRGATPALAAAKGKKPWYETIAWPVIILTCIITFFVLDHGSSYKRREAALTFDEGVYIRLALQLKQGEPYNTIKLWEEKKKSRLLPDYMSRPLFKHPPLYPWLVSMSYAMLEQKSTYRYEELYEAAANVSNLMACLLVLLGFLFARRYFGYPAAYLTAFLLAIDLNIALCGQKVWIASTLAFLTFASLYLVFKACEEHRAWFYPAGIVFGLAMLTKYTAVLVVPIMLSYILIYRRDLFRCKELYFFFGLAFLVFLPWLVTNMKVYGMDALTMMILRQTRGPQKMLYFGIFAAAVIAATWGAIILYQRMVQKHSDADGTAVRTQWFPFIGVGLISLFFAMLFVHKPYVTSALKSLNWMALPNAGWDMKIYKQEPWYFYFKQHLEYSPYYLIMFVAFLRAPLGRKPDMYLLLSSVWVLLFATMWKNFQGRYAVQFVTPTLILIAATIIAVYQLLLRHKNIPGYAGLTALSLALLYLTLKALKVYGAIALHNNVAYF
ncbi:MAG: glycosyltransferase family 39 protein [Candidatus Omnitrophica bacterium]|nr:glycosyltransferase family 39 protein [Candidatus Omnitrophota bacterium]